MCARRIWARLWCERQCDRRGAGARQIEDVILGCAFPEGKQGMQIGRMVVLAAGLPYTVPGQTVNRFCSSGLQSIALAAERIMAGFADVIVAGGVESMSGRRWAGLLFPPTQPWRWSIRASIWGWVSRRRMWPSSMASVVRIRTRLLCDHINKRGQPSGREVHGRGRPGAGARDLGGR